MIAQIAQVSLSALRDATRTYFDPSTSTWQQAWKEHAGDKYVAHYPTGQACIWGPMVIGNPNEPFFEIQAENQATYDLIAGLSNSMANLKGVARTNGLIRAFMRTSGRELIRNSQGKVVGYLPAFGLGQDLRSAFFGDEDTENAQEILGLE